MNFSTKWHRFEELSSLRETVPEMQLELFREHAAQRERAAQKLINHLRYVVATACIVSVAMIRAPWFCLFTAAFNAEGRWEQHPHH